MNPVSLFNQYLTKNLRFIVGTAALSLVIFFRDRRVTTERLPQAAPKRPPLHLSLIAVLGLATCLPALAEPTAPAAVAVVSNDTITDSPAPTTAAAPATVGAAAATPSPRQRVDAAATATLAALLPHLASNDTVPLMDRSAMVAGDIGRLMAAYDAAQGTPGHAQEASQGKAASLLDRAMSLLGTPYRWGGTSPDGGFDCSGLVSYVFRTALGIELPRVSRDMARLTNGQAIERSALTAGDLVFFGRNGKRVDHVGIYVGEGRFLHAPSAGKDVRVDSMTQGYWSTRFMSARRVEM